MKPRTTDLNCLRWQRSELLLIPTVLSLGLLTACMAPPAYDADTTLAPEEGIDSPVATESGATYPPQASPETDTASASTQFNFPLATCGDHASEPSETWYSVFVDGSNVDEIRTRYCGDAISTTREKSGTPTVQVASFTSYARALSLAKAIGGVVEQTAQAAPTANGYQSAERPNTPASQPAPAPQPTTPAQTGQTAFLNASEAGIPINIRENASTNAEVQSTGYAGDRVQISNQVQGDDGYTWYQVRLESGTAGWVRGDLISAQAPAVNQPPASQSPDYSQAPNYSQPPNYSQAPTNPAPSYQPPYAQPGYGQSPDYGQAPNYSQPEYGQPGYGQAPYAQPGYGQPEYGQPPYSQSPGYTQPPNAPYGNSPYGTGRDSALTAREPGSTINIREYASPNSRVRYRANPGDPVQIWGSAQGEDGQMWYQVRFSSGAVGWVRSDLVARN